MATCSMFISRCRVDIQNFFLSVNIWQKVYINIFKMPCCGRKCLLSHLNSTNHTLPASKSTKNGKNWLFKKNYWYSYMTFIGNFIHGLFGSRGHKSTNWGRKWWGANHWGVQSVHYGPKKRNQRRAKMVEKMSKYIISFLKSVPLHFIHHIVSKKIQ